MRIHYGTEKMCTDSSTWLRTRSSCIAIRGTHKRFVTVVNGNQRAGMVALETAVDKVSSYLVCIYTRIFAHKCMSVCVCVCVCVCIYIYIYIYIYTYPTGKGSMKEFFISSVPYAYTHPCFIHMHRNTTCFIHT